MVGMYCYSWWIVPHNYPKIMREYGMDHIPHITVKSRMSFPVPHPSIGMEFDMRFYGNIIPLHPQGYGVMCEMEEWGKLSMTLRYYGVPGDTKNNLELIKGIFCCANCLDPRPQRWEIITEKV